MAKGPSAELLRRMAEGEEIPRSQWTSPGGSPNHRQVTGALHYTGTGDPSHLDSGPYVSPGGTLAIEGIGGYATSVTDCLLASIYRGQELGHDRVVSTLMPFLEHFLALLSLFFTVPLEQVSVRKPTGFRALVRDRCGSHVPRRDRGEQVTVAIAVMAVTGETCGIPSHGGSGWWGGDWPGGKWNVGAWFMRRMIEREMRAPRLPVQFDERLAMARKAGLYGGLIYVRTSRGFYAYAEECRGWDHPHPAVKVVRGLYDYISPREAGLPAWNTRGDNGRTEKVGGEIRAWQRVERGPNWQAKEPLDWEGRLPIGNTGDELGRWDLRSTPWPAWDLSGEKPVKEPTPPPPSPDEPPQSPGPSKPGPWSILPKDITAEDIQRDPESARLVITSLYALLDQAAAGRSTGDLKLGRARRAATRHQRSLVRGREEGG